MQTRAMVVAPVGIETLEHQARDCEVEEQLMVVDNPSVALEKDITTDMKQDSYYI